MTEDTSTDTIAGEIMTEATSPRPLSNKWTFRDFPEAERRDATEAARRADVAIPEWVATAIREKLAREREAEFGANHEVIPPGREEARSTALVAIRRMSVEELTRAFDLAVRLAELRGKPVPARFLSRASRLLAERLRDAG